MHIGRILLGWLAIGVVVAMIVMALVACGVISVHVEIVPKDEEEKRRKERGGEAAREDGLLEEASERVLEDSGVSEADDEKPDGK